MYTTKVIFALQKFQIALFKWKVGSSKHKAEIKKERIKRSLDQNIFRGWRLRMVMILFGGEED